MSDPRFARVVVGLVRETEAGRIKWLPTAEEDIYQASFPKYSVQLSIQGNPTNGGITDDVVVSVRNNEGAVLDRFADTDVPRELLADPYRTMYDLYVRARRQALGADKAIDDLLQILEEL